MIQNLAEPSPTRQQPEPRPAVRDVVAAENPPMAPVIERKKKAIPGVEYWRARPRSVGREMMEVAGVLGVVTLGGWFVPISYHAFGHIYLLVVIVLSLRVGRWAALGAAVLSGAAWNFVFMAPRLSFSLADFEDDILLLGTYFAAALIGGQLAARIREEERRERQREQRATALFHLTRALAAARTLDEAAEAALRQADELFNARTTLGLAGAGDELRFHPAGSLVLDERSRALARVAWRTGQATGRFTAEEPEHESFHVPLRRGERVVGVLAVALRERITALSSSQRDLIDGFAAQIALLVEREELRVASEREKLRAESGRLHRTLLDSISHELKTPLAVLRTAADKLDTDDAYRRATLLGEVRTAMSRLDHLVGNLLNQTRLEAGMMKPRFDWCEAGELIAAAERAIEPALAGHTLRVELPAELPLVFGDPVLLEQVLANLLLNAARHTPRGTIVRVSAGVDEVERRIFVTVADDGPGIPAELRGEIFQKFRRGQTARTGGLGLGLSIVRGFMVAQGGDVEVADSPEGGASFTIRLPLIVPGNIPDDES